MMLIYQAFLEPSGCIETEKIADRQGVQREMKAYALASRIPVSPYVCDEPGSARFST